MAIKIGVVMDPIQSVTYKKDSTLAMLWEADSRNWQIFYMLQTDLYIEQGQARAKMTRLHPKKDPNHWYEFAESDDIALSELDTILMRKDPPFDMNFIYTTYVLDQARADGVLIVNHPQSLRDCNEKLFATHFPQCCPDLLVASDARQLRAFHASHRDVIFKPLDGMGGSSIFHVRDDDTNLSVIIETLTLGGKQQIMAQKYVPEISAGDKRILMIDGEPVPYALARVPAQGESRGNLAAGGSGVAQKLSDRDRWICEQVGPTIKEKGLLFVGLDVIGDYLTEINVTSPTCVRELDQAFDLDIGGQLMDCIADKLSKA